MIGLRDHSNTPQTGWVSNTPWGFGFRDVNAPESKAFVQFMNKSRNKILTILNDLFAQIGKEPLSLVREVGADGFVGVPRKRQRPARQRIIKKKKEQERPNN